MAPDREPAAAIAVANNLDLRMTTSNAVGPRLGRPVGRGDLEAVRKLASLSQYEDYDWAAFR